jgi:DNA-binding transcriptional ArsR family regulator
MTDTTANLLSAELAARLILVEPAELDRLRRAKVLAPAVTNPPRYRLADLVHAYVRHLKSEQDKGCTAAEAAAHLGIHRRSFIDLVDSGIIERRKQGQYRLAEVRDQYLTHLRETAAARAEANGESISQSRARLIAAKADMAEAERQKAQGGWARISVIMDKVQRDYSIVRELILATPGTIAYQLEGRTRAEIFEMLDEHLRTALNELSEPKALRGEVSGERELRQACEALRGRLSTESFAYNEIAVTDELSAAARQADDAIKAVMAVLPDGGSNA